MEREWQKNPGQFKSKLQTQTIRALLTQCFTSTRLKSFAVGCSLEVTVGPYGHETLSLPVKVWPELLTGNSNNEIRLTGSFEFRFGGVENGSVVIAESSIEVTQMFRSGLDIDEFI
jgi:hypothetical protein